MWLLVAALVAIRIVMVPVALAGSATHVSGSLMTGDAGRYHQIANASGTPYRDFEVEFPPVTLAAIHAIDGGNLRATTVRLMWSQVTLDLAIAALVAWGWGRRASLAYLLIGLPFALYPFLYLRLDLVCVALVVAGLAAVRRRHERTGGILIALACFAKIWPLALVPVFLIRRSYRALTSFAITAVVGIIAWMLWAGPDALRQVATFRGARGWEIESSIGAVIHLAGNTPVEYERGAFRIGTVPGAATVALSVTAIALVVTIWIVAARQPPRQTTATDATASLAAITAVLLTATIISPQYVSWLLPFAAIAAAYGKRILAALTAAVVALTVVGATQFFQLVAGDPFPAVLLLARNACLWALLIASLSQLARQPRTTDLPIRQPAL